MLLGVKVEVGVGLGVADGVLVSVGAGVGVGGLATMGVAISEVDGCCVGDTVCVAVGTVGEVGVGTTSGGSEHREMKKPKSTQATAEVNAITREVTNRLIREALPTTYGVRVKSRVRTISLL